MSETVWRAVLSLLGFTVADKAPPSCEVLAAVSGKKITGPHAYATLIFLSIATGGVVVPEAPPPSGDEIVVTDLGDCVFEITRRGRSLKVIASQNDGGDPVMPWRVRLLL